ncbi:MAG TPA: prolyl oligopeptidase family serine peptidase [Phycisphaerales bacterium]|nr:prolyl oligopeptidase family serine peptidase [Phycisphaerales bacterium]
MLTLLLSCALALSPELNADLTITEVLVLPPTSAGGRAPFRADAVQGALVRGDFRAPSAGDSFAGKEWKALTALDGQFQDRALIGGYAFATVDSSAEKVMILEAPGSGMVYFNSEPRAGDPYEHAFTRIPVLVHKGRNEILAHSGRGRLSLRLAEPAAPVFIDLGDPTLSDLVQGSGDPVIGGLVIINATGAWQRNLTAGVACEGAATSTALPPIPPMSTRKVPVSFTPAPLAQPGEVEYRISLTGPNLPAGSTPETRVKLRVRTPAQVRKVTFISGIDGSVQYYCINPATEKDAPNGLVLSLHGASVQATNQAEAYRSKPDLDIVAPTNRRPFGFDWEDWGRADGLEVLEHATRALKPDPSRIYLTGHSMGGHGTWQFGALFPDRFAAIAPSAGWISFWSYAGARESDNPTPLESLFRRSMNTSDTLKLSRNYLMQGIYILHGDADDNVPVTQARTMREHLAKYHADFAYYERPGAGHWWGNECVDWDPIFEFFRHHRLKTNEQTDRIEFTTANPAVSASCRWATIQQQEVMGDFSTILIDLDRSRRTFELKKSDNVARLRLDLAHLASIAGGKGSVYFKHPGGELDITPDADTTAVELAKSGDTWKLATPLRAADKNPRRSSGWKQAIGNRVVLVYATRGDDAEKTWALSKARYDAETWQYRANGAFDIIPDTDFDPAAYRDRNVLLYGNMETNAAWSRLLPDSPIRVSREGIVVGNRDFAADDLVAMFIRPRADSDTAVVGVVAPTGIKGCRAADRIGYFGSGVGYPDWTVFSSDVFDKGLGGVKAAGFFTNDWQVGEIVE